MSARHERTSMRTSAEPTTRPLAGDEHAPVDSPFATFLRRVARRVAVLAMIEGAATGLVLAAVVASLAWLGSGHVLRAIAIGVVFAAAGVVARMVTSSRDRRQVASIVERRAAGSRNIIVTAAELVDRPAPMREDIRARVFRDADRTTGALDPATLFPARRAALALVGGAGLWALALMLVSAQPAASDSGVPVAIESVTIDAIDVVVTPPAYTGRMAQSLSNPARVEALAGSMIRVSVRATAAAVRIETIGGRQSATPGAARTFSHDIVADADGFIAIEAVASDSQPGERRLIGLAVTPDRPPRVRVTTPGRDLFVPEARGTLDVSIEADDDLALASLKLRYTKVSGSGERFTFIEGEVPVTVTRTDAQRWTARGTLPIGAMELGQGDVIVYRGVATDRRPGAPSVESDAFLVEITAPGAVASEGFAADDEFDRNAVSQQMVILKTERLLARRSSMTPDAVAEEARNIAAEQRRVRAEFVFMMGGELAEEVTGATGISELHEEEEAEASDDILAGRLANRGRVELVRAIRAMSGADAKLGAVDVAGALKDEQLALEHLQNAFSRTRYILRALTQRERLDLTRRLTGVLADAGRDVRPLPETVTDPRIAALREALGRVAALASAAGGAASPSAGVGDTTVAPDPQVSASILAQDVLRVDPSSEELQAVAAQLSDAGTAFSARRAGDARDLLDRAATSLAVLIRSMLVDAADEPRSLELRRLEGALVDALRGATPR